MCAACRRELAALRRLNRLLAARPAARPAIDWTAFETRLADRLAHDRTGLRWRPWYRQGAVLGRAALAAAAILVLVGGGVWLDRSLRHTGLTALPALEKAGPYRTAGDSTLVYDQHGALQLIERRPQPEAATVSVARPTDLPLHLAWLNGERPPPRARKPPSSRSAAVTPAEPPRNTAIRSSTPRRKPDTGVRDPLPGPCCMCPSPFSRSETA